MMVDFILKRNAGMIVVVELKIHVVSTYIFSIVICQFSYGLDSYLVVLLSINKSTKISFYCTVLSFGLTVCLWTKCSRKFLLNAKEVK